MRFVLLYNCPIKGCDRLWLYEGLSKYGAVRVIPCLTNKSYFTIVRSMPFLKIGKTIVLLLFFIRSVMCILTSKKGDIIVTWPNKLGCMIENMCRLFGVKRRIVSFNWINLTKGYDSAVAGSFRNENFMPIINNPSLEKDFLKKYNLKQWNGLFLPDVYNDKNVFEKPIYNRKYKYVFAGGSNNRDWDLLIRVAKETPNIKYIIVCDKDAINISVPKNVIFKESLSANEYYDLMKKAFITVCPLKEDRSSGLINIMKSAQFGIPCISTRFGVTEMYYSKKNDVVLLCEPGDYNDLKDKISKLYGLCEKKYIEVTNEFQKYIKENFNPERDVEKLMSELKRRGWMK